MSETSQILDRDGIFKAKVTDWAIEKKDDAKSIGVRIGFLITAQYENGEWTSWEDYMPHTIRGWWYPIRKNGQTNASAVEQMVRSMNWNGDLRWFKEAPLDDILVQITVKTESFTGNDGQTRSSRKATWMNPADWEPTGGGASDEDIDKLQSQFGSLLKAAASAAKPKSAPTSKPVPAQKAPPKQTRPQTAPAAPPPMPEPPDDRDVPFP